MARWDEAGADPVADIQAVADAGFKAWPGWRSADLPLPPYMRGTFMRAIARELGREAERRQTR